ncbi:sigma-70 family RNA polymerase sigma factor [Pseudomonas taiwanensis]|uniref:sigma-70 family RNA polymerase sigma factor n=1 Tax=Pseudomonas taiwanensis TaxID=470150 RepID=UPI0028DE07D7|nr:sigma-70 family RNA polymerase sigma factor [Pseudomonas taiwanensis]MDT8924911.1 sigma-70 family RNA polymerase sigma factor [Pseudomonas taiwanensis]
MSAFGTRSKPEIFMAAKQGCRRSQNIFLIQNRLLVTKIAQCYLCNPRLSSEHDDIIQEGLMGMYRALEKFNVELGFSFSTYAVPWIRAYIERFLRSSLIKLSMPTRMRDLAWKVRGLSQKYSLEAISESLGIDLTLATSLFEMTDVLPLDTVSENHGHSVEDLVIMQTEIQRVSQAFERLPALGKAALLIKIGEHQVYDGASNYLADHDISRYDFDKTAKLSLAAMKSALCA